MHQPRKYFRKFYEIGNIYELNDILKFARTKWQAKASNAINKMLSDIENAIFIIKKF